MNFRSRVVSGTAVIAAVVVVLAAAGPARRELNDSIRIKLIRIDAGSFQMGQDGAQHDFRFSRFPERVDAGD